MLLARLACLPDDCALHAAIRGEPRGWGADRHLLASTVDAISQNSWVTASVASTKRLKKPAPLKRPNTKTRRVVTVADLNRSGGDEDGGTGRP